MKIKIIMFLGLFLLVLVTPVIATQEQTGEIVAVNDNVPSILLDNSEEVKEYSLALNNSIKLNGREVSINALKPIKDNIFQEAVIKTNQAEKIIEIESFYKVVSIAVKEVNKKEIVVNNLNSNQILKYDITEDLSIEKNNQVSKLENLKKGEQGLLILGREDKARKIILNNYSRVE